MLVKDWIRSQNELTCRFDVAFLHVRNVPCFLLFILGSELIGFIAGLLLGMGYFFLMMQFFPPSIKEKEKTIYAVIIQFLDRRLEVLGRKVSIWYFKFMNFIW